MNSTSPIPDSDNTGASLRAIAAGLCASLVGIGLARFAYTPLIPSLIEARWFSVNDVIYLGAANLLGYLAGALLGRPMARRHSAHAILRAMMLLASLAFFACAFPLSVSWFFVWRFLSGLAGGSIMVLVASTVLPHVPAQRRGLAGGAIFVGIGIGVAASGSLVPLLMQLGLRAAWLGLGSLSLLLAIISWTFWPATPPTGKPVPSKHGATPPAGTALALNTLFVQYALMAVALVPMMVFLVDYIARGMGWGTHEAAVFWVIYGLGAIAGPMLYGALADHIGPAMTGRLALLLQAVALAVMMVSRQHVVLMLATFVVGTFPPGIVPIVLGRLHQLLGHDVGAQNAAWSRATTVFALFQALAGYGYSWLFSHSGGNYHALLLTAISALLLALLADGVQKLLSRKRSPATL
ncbi:YbfB/YjiJ family MFS transporter [Janthinobacterium psychrotolerans]|uniref:Putative arabinose efflux permease, MFS family n=1 Tax=Janthinobacterium psychrotolerans TaxID=1747903 RepID=A0A1A7CA05_9BURK|nr:YbfB/YjiJ family MFS transporter [Janthinobacterium psychrotolerans]OBV41143.1 putative arabinose efflux permease, MFS family [Janthinobacterium psychrotolerans]